MLGLKIYIMKKAQWIWYGAPLLNLVNSWMEARRTFSLKSVPKQAIIRVTADSRYRLYVNGTHINRGPARGFQLSWPYDTLDISSYLKKGKNVIAVLVHNFGIGNFQYIHRGYAGLLLSGVINRINVSTNKLWRVRPAPGYKPVTTRVSQQLGFEEYFDANQEDESWLLPNYNDKNWRTPHVRDFGVMPWNAVEERGIPLLRERLALPEKLVSVAKGKCHRDYLKTTNVVQLYCDEKKKWKQADQHLQKTKDWVAIEVSPTGKDGYIACCIDFGKEVTGSIRLSVTGAKGTELIDSLITEGIDGFKPYIRAPDKIWGGNSFGNRLTLRSGKTEHEQYDYWGFRYLVLVVRNSTKRLKIKLRVHGTGYPLEIKAAFESSNPILNKIYEISAWTQQCCMFDTYVDCPWREQAQWWGDARVQAGNTFYLSADSRLVKRGIKQIGTQEVPNGLTYGHAPTIAHECILPDFTLVWIITHWDYYWQTGDLSLFKEMKSRIHRALHYFHNAIAKNGLLPYDKRYWLFLDWTGLFKDGYPTLYNLLYLMALRKAIELFRLIGDKQSIQLYSNREKKLTKAITKLLFNQKTLTFYGGLTWENKPFHQTSPHNLAFAILLDLFPKNQQKFSIQLKKLIKNYQLFENVKGLGDIKQPVIPSPYFIFYIYEALKKLGENEPVISSIERLWSNMVKKGLTTTEEIWNAEPGHHSLCHAWSAHPIIHFSNILLGIKQTKPAWKEITFSPIFSHADFVRGKVATPFGVIESDWEKADGKIKVYLKLPKGIIAKIVLPGKKTAKIKNEFKAEL